MQQIAMGGVDLYDLEARSQGALGRFDEGSDDILDLVRAQLPWRGVFRVEGNF
jgi:hypothetical protein